MKLESLIPHTLIRKTREYTRKLWVRVMIMGLMAFVALGVTQILEAFIPKEIGTTLTGEAADRLLQIIANAMLAVTTFSITVMVTVYRASSTQWTPRVHRLIIQDRTTQNTLAVFIGAYVYALVAIIMRELGIYVDERALVLFVMTVIVLAVIVIYLIRWVLHLQSFGSLIDTTRQIESVTRAQFQDRLKNPCLGANALTGKVPEDATAIHANESGYIQHIYPEALNAVAKAHGVELYLTKNIGHFAFLNEPLLMAVARGTAEDDEHDWESLEKAVHENIRLGDLRTFDQDPRFGLVVMGEVASKALSPGVNDPGTAIDVITRIGRILSLYIDENAEERENKLEYIYVRPLEPQDLVEDGFGALARDGATVVEVQQRLQSVLSGLMRHPDNGLSKAARAAAEIHLRRALEAIAFEPDRARVLNSARSDVRDAIAESAKSSDT
ncbi:MAG: DUF2254 domain-containing protein [Sulfitobacter sp.]